MGIGNGLFMPYLLGCTGCSGDDGICFFLTAFCFALNLGDRGSIIFYPTGYIRVFHAFLCHSNHLGVSIPHREQRIPIQVHKRKERTAHCPAVRSFGLRIRNMLMKPIDIRCLVRIHGQIPFLDKLTENCSGAVFRHLQNDSGLFYGNLRIEAHLVHPLQQL